MSVGFKRFLIDDAEERITCGLCDMRSNIRWRCLDCRMKLCDTCKIIHSNARMSTSHTIISFDDVDCFVLDFQVKNRIMKLPCTKHPHQNYTLFCKTCNRLVCSSCIPKNHILHEVRGFDRFIDEKLKQADKEVIEILPKRFLARSPSDEDSYYKASEDFIVKHSVTTKLRDVYFLRTDLKDSAWIGCFDNKKLEKVKIPFKSKRPCVRFLYNALKKDMECTYIDQIENFKAMDIEICNDDLFFVSYLDHNLKRAFTDNFGQKHICNIYDFHPLDPTCIHIEKESQVIWIGLTERGHDILTPVSTRKVVSISAKWQIEKSFEFTESGKRLFTFPFRIRSLGEQLCVVDRTSTKTGRVISLNSQGHPLWEYKNSQNTNTFDKLFFPTAISTTKTNKIIVIDAANSTIHVLNSAGNILLFKPLADINIHRPFSLDIDQTGQLWIGSFCEPGEQTAKLHVLQMTM